MIQITVQTRILVAIQGVDFRKGIDGLAQVCQEQLQTDPFEEEVSNSRSPRSQRGERTGLFTSGIVSTTRQGQRIALFFTGRNHAGENLARVLAERAKGLAPPIQMSDALSRNVPKLEEKLEILWGNCNAHARRRFVEVTPNFPEECRFVLESFRDVYRYEAESK
ncbi:MAG: IS66 family insertion sequence element accessory protein TnpB [Acidobacteriia bacterium]|nr:IS66 family insertion sequence element accessory protein TnpB [Terriglobia bacterium]